MVMKHDLLYDLVPSRAFWNFIGLTVDAIDVGHMETSYSADMGNKSNMQPILVDSTC